MKPPADNLPASAATLPHAEPVEALLIRLGTQLPAGLASAEAQRRLLRFGMNRLSGKAPPPAWRRLLEQFRSALALVLLAAALLAGLVGDLKDACIIAAVLLLDALLGFIQERRAEAALAALKQMLAPEARVRRDGRSHLIAAVELVPGDLLLLQAGDKVPADARVVAAHAAEVAEAALTGESQAVGKSPQAVAGPAALGERSSMLYMNTVVTRGRLEAVVTATGMGTEIGRVARLLDDIDTSATPLQRQLDRLGKRLATIAVTVVSLLFVLGLARGDDLLQTALTAIALAVAAIPEGLPAVVAVTLALGMQRMAERHAIVKKMAAVETLGCTTVICTDKTGTLTRNQMSARQFFFLGRRFEVSGEGYSGDGSIGSTDGDDLPPLRPLLLPAALCADARLRAGKLIGDPTEGALLALAGRGGLDAAEELRLTPRLAEIPFDAAHKFMATFHRQGDVVRMWLKGAPDVLMSRASRCLGQDGPQVFDAAARAAFSAQTAQLTEQAMRVLALAQRDIPLQEFAAGGELMHWAGELTLIGVVGLIDPPRDEAREAIRVCLAAGIAVKMITGDHRDTAAAIARDLGLIGEVHQGHEIDGLDQTALAGLVLRTAVFARVAPEHKMRIVEALKAQGQVVAMTGDGVNDAPALKAADIGVAMGGAGTEVAREAASLILTDDNFATIIGAIKEGRTIYDNIVKFVRFQLATNIGAMLTVLLAPLLGLPTPFTAIQILWVNIIADGPPAMTLGAEPARPDLMRSPPRRPDADILTGARLRHLGLSGLVMAAGTLFAYAWGLQRAGHPYALTLAFTTFVLFQLFNIFNARAETGSVFNRQFFANHPLWGALAGVALLQVAVVHWEPAQALFDTVPLTGGDWLLATAIAASVLLFEEGRKLLAAAWRRP